MPNDSGTETTSKITPNELRTSSSVASAPPDTPAAPSITEKWNAMPVSHEQARQAILALVDEHFHNNKRRTQFSIPVRSDDTDTLLMRYVKQQEAAAPPSPPSEGREQFERLAAELGFPLTISHIDEPGQYLNENTQGAWVIWQAARASVPAAPEEKPAETPKDNAETEKE